MPLAKFNPCSPCCSGVCPDLPDTLIGQVTGSGITCWDDLTLTKVDSKTWAGDIDGYFFELRRVGTHAELPCMNFRLFIWEPGGSGVVGNETTTACSCHCLPYGNIIVPVDVNTSSGTVDNSLLNEVALFTRPWDFTTPIASGQDCPLVFQQQPCRKTIPTTLTATIVRKGGSCPFTGGSCTLTAFEPHCPIRWFGGVPVPTGFSFTGICPGTDIIINFNDSEEFYNPPYSVSLSSSFLPVFTTVGAEPDTFNCSPFIAEFKDCKLPFPYDDTTYDVIVNE